MGVANYISGKPVMVRHTEAGTHAAGDVIVVGATPFVAHDDVPMFAGGTLLDALSTGGGVYQLATDGTPVVGQDAYFNPTSKKLTAAVAGAVHFGVLVAGPSGDLAGASPAADGDYGYALHRPKSVTPTGVKSEATQSTTATLTAAQVLAGFLNSAPAGAVTLTLPTAAALVAGMKGAKAGDQVELVVENTSGGANTVTLAAAAGGTLRGGTAVAQNKAALVRILLTNVGSGTEAYTAYSLVGA